MLCVRVVDLSTSIAGSYCSRLLGTCGADVVKVDRPPDHSSGAGCPQPVDEREAVDPSAPDALELLRPSYLESYKRSLCVRSARAEGGRVMGSLVAQADIVVASFDGDPSEAYALCALVREESPDCTIVVTSPFGLTGPYAGYRGSDLISWASSGHLQITGDPDREPLQGGGPWGDYATGIAAAIGGLAAHRARLRDDSPGDLVDVATMEVMASLHQWTTMLFSYQGVIRERAGNRLAPAHHPMGPMPCRDGWVTIGGGKAAHWEGLCIALDMPELIVDERFQTTGERFDRADELDALLNPKLAEHSADELLALLRAHRVPVGPVRNLVEVLQDPQLECRRFWTTVEIDELLGMMPDKAFKVPTADREFSPAPAVGQHTLEILAELGYGPTEIAGLLGDGAVVAGQGQR